MTKAKQVKQVKQVKAAGKKAETKAKTPKPTSKAVEKVKHERMAKPSEETLIAKNRTLGAHYLILRDGMDENVASMVIDGMDADALADLIAEANVSDLNGNKFPQDKTRMNVADPVVDDSDGGSGESTELEFIDFTDNEVLAGAEEFPGLMLEVRDAGRRKNEAEKEYKAKKKALVEWMKKAKAERIMCLGQPLTLYKGHTLTLDEHKLIEAGVDVEMIKKGWKDTAWDDVRFGKPVSVGE